MAPLLDEGAELDEQAMRTFITWVVDGTTIKGEPMIEVFPEVEEYMLDNYDPSAVTLTQKF